MIVNVNYGNKVVVLPALSEEIIKKASADDLRVLFAVALKGSGEIDLKAVAEKLESDLGAVIMSLSFWQKIGVVGMAETYGEASELKTARVDDRPDDGASRKILKKSDEVPRYTTEELSALLERREETSHLIDECQQAFGKIFNTHEINILLGLVDYLALGWDYVLELLGFCARQGKHSINYVERTAFSFVEDGIDSVGALKAKINELEALKANETFVRRLFGMKSRALTAKEKKCISGWFGKFGYGEEVVTKAYEITVSATNEPSVPYANAVLERWFSEGLTTIEDVERSISERAEAKKQESDSGSFDTDDFFESALRRSCNKN